MHPVFVWKICYFVKLLLVRLLGFLHATIYLKFNCKFLLDGHFCKSDPMKQLGGVGPAENFSVLLLI